MITDLQMMPKGYSLDDYKVLKVQQLDFKDNFYSLILTKVKYKHMSADELYTLISSTMISLDCTTSKGFLTSHDLSEFPIISELLSSFITGDCVEYINGDKSMESYKWLYNFILITLYNLCIETIHTKVSDETDLISDFLVLEQELYGRLDPTIRHHLQKRGVSIKENTYIGFDTEFTNKDTKTNTLVSAQLAVTTKLYIQIPQSRGYKISYMDEKTNRLIPQKTNSSVFNYSKLELSIQMCVAEVRRIKYGKIDLDLLIITECLRLIKGFKYYDKDDYTIFTLPRSVIQPYIHVGKSFSLEEALEISSRIAKPYVERSNNLFMYLLRDIVSKKFNLSDGKEKLLDQIQQVYGDYREVEQIGLDFSKPLSLIPIQSLPLVKNEKRLSRKYMIDLFEGKISITKLKCYYLIAHLTPADLSMLKDFEEIKEDLSIVNGSFVTLGKAIKFKGKNVHVRDTMLLAPGGSKSLASIGMLYSNEFNKVQIDKEDLEDMQGFLVREKEKFTEYALRDAIIALIHAS
jgi:hypothetical protein